MNADPSALPMTKLFGCFNGGVLTMRLVEFDKLKIEFEILFPMNLSFSTESLM